MGCRSFVLVIVAGLSCIVQAVVGFSVGNPVSAIETRLTFWIETHESLTTSSIFAPLKFILHLSLDSQQVFAVCPAGYCQFNEDWIEVPLTKVEQISEDTKVFTFATPDTSKPLNLPTCACLLAQGGKDAEGNPFIRPYTPISTNSLVGEFQLMVKIYPDGNLSQHMNAMKVGDTLEFKHIKFNVKKQYPFGTKNVSMLVGGTGITPMIQALHAILGNSEDTTKVQMLYGSQKADQILAEVILRDWQKAYPNRLSVTHVLSNEPERKWYKNFAGAKKWVKVLLSKIPLLPIKPPAGSSWKGDRGFITKELIEKHFPGPEADTNIFVCGPPPMYNALCGPREEEEISGVLAEMGYSKDQITKF